MVEQLESERLAYEHMLGQFKTNGNSGMIQKLEAAPVTSVSLPPDRLLNIETTAFVAAVLPCPQGKLLGESEP